MSAKDSWVGLSRGQQAGFAGGLLVIAGLTAGLAYWTLRDPWVTVTKDLPADRIVTIGKELSREKLEHRIGEDGASIEVHKTALGRARTLVATGGEGLPVNVGLEIFKETDFSTTDFAQRINLQRALQGELTRTLQGMAGVKHARVHLVLPEAGVLKRGTVKASAAITLGLHAGKVLSRSQVRGIQKLVAASVSEIKPEDVVVLDEAGASLVRDGGTDVEASGAPLELKRQVDGYLEAKLTRLLEEMSPGMQVSLSVDTLLDHKQSKVTLEEPIAAAGPKGAERSTGVVVRERQVDRSVVAAETPGAAAPVPSSTDFDIEYKVGNRVEQSLVAPGAIRRISVAVALHGAPAGVTEARIEQLVSHAVGIDRARGDAVMVMLMGPVAQSTPAALARGAQTRLQAAPNAVETAVERSVSATQASVPVALAGLLALAALVSIWAAARHRRAARAEDAQVAALAEQLGNWLGAGNDPNNR
jgi:flagellar M-ring protein FliF